MNVIETNRVDGKVRITIWKDEKKEDSLGVSLSLQEAYDLYSQLRIIFKDKEV